MAAEPRRGREFERGKCYANCASARDSRGGPARGSHVQRGAGSRGGAAQLPGPPRPAPGPAPGMEGAGVRSETAESRGTAAQSVSDLAGWEFPFSGLPGGELFQISTTGKPAILHNDFSMPRSGAPRPCAPTARSGRRATLGTPPVPGRPGPRARGPHAHPCPAALASWPERGGLARGEGPALGTGPRATPDRRGRDVTAGRGLGSGWAAGGGGGVFQL